MRLLLIALAMIATACEPATEKESARTTSSAVTDQAAMQSSLVAANSSFRFVERKKGKAKGTFTTIGTEPSLMIEGSNLTLGIQDSVMEEPDPDPRTRKIPKPKKSSFFGMTFKGSNPKPSIVGMDPSQERINLYMSPDPSQWEANITPYNRVKVAALYKDIDLFYAGNSTSLKYEFVLAPNADSKRIKMQFKDAKSLTIDGLGNLTVTYATKTIVHKAPYTYQLSSTGNQEPIKSSYNIKNDTVGFDVASYDHSRALVIDPVIDFHVMIGSTPGNEFDMAVDASGNPILLGQGHVFDDLGPVLNDYGGAGLRISKFSKLTQSMEFSTFFGSADGGVSAQRLTVSGHGIFVVGSTSSTAMPLLSEGGGPAIQSSSAGGQDALIFKLSPSGTLAYSTYLGGSQNDAAVALDTDSAGNLYVAGQAGANNFPTTCCIQAAPSTDSFVAKINPTGSALLFSSYVSPSGGSIVQALDRSDSGSLFISGTIGPDCGIAPHVAKVDSATGAITRRTCVGASGLAQIRDLKIVNDNGADGVVIVGTTLAGSFTPTGNAFQSVQGNSRDGIIAKLSGSGAVSYLSYFGGNLSDFPTRIAVDSQGDVAIAGYTCSTNLSLLNAINTLPPACSPGQEVPSDGFVAVFNPAGTALTFSTLLGSPVGNERVTGIAFDANDNLLVSGWTDTPENFVPALTAGLAGQTFILKLSNVSPPANTPPVLALISPSTISATEHVPVIFDANASDSDQPPQALIFSLVGAPPGASINSSSGLFGWTPGESDGGSTFSFSVKVTDSTGLTDEQTVTVAVAEANAAPTIGQIDDQTVAEGTAFSIGVTATDADLPTNFLQFELIEPSRGALIDATSGQFSWTPTEAQGPGSYEFVVRVTDSAGAYSDRSFRIAVLEANLPPLLILDPIGPVTFDAMTTLTAQVSALDLDLPAQAITLSLDAPPPGAVFDVETGAFTWTPGWASQTTTYYLVFRATDSFGASTTKTLVATVGHINAAPTIDVIGDKAIDENATLSFVVPAHDLDLPNDSLTFSLVGPSYGASIGTTSGFFQWTPSAQDAGSSFDFLVKAQDSEGAEVVRGFRVLVGVVSGAPQIDPIASQIVDEGNVVNLTVTSQNPSDPSEQATYELINPPLGAEIDTNTGEFSWIPLEAHGPGIYQIGVKATGSTGLFAIATFTVQVLEANAPPSLDALSDVRIKVGETMQLAVTATDPDLPIIQALSFDMSGLPNGAVLTSTGPWAATLTWTPTVDDLGAKSVSLFAADPDGAFAIGAVTIFVADNDRIAVTDPDGISQTFSSLQGAINAVTGPGFTLLVGPGNYDEDLDIQGKTDLRVIGIDLPTVNSFNLNASSGITIDSFDVLASGPGKNGIRIGSQMGANSQVSIVNNTVRDGSVQNCGIYIDRNSADIVIAGNEIANNGQDGIFLAKGSTGKVSITDNIISNNGYNGIRIGDDFVVDIVKNTIEANGWRSGQGGGRYGIYKVSQAGFDPAKITLVDNVIQNNQGNVEPESSSDLGNFSQLLNLTAPCTDRGNLTSGNFEGPGVGGADCGYSPDAPNVTLSFFGSNPTNVAPIVVEIEFDKPVSGLNAAGLQISGGTLLNLTGGGASYAASLSRSTPGDITIRVLADAAVDEFAHGNNTSAPLTIAYLGGGPAVTLSIDANPATVTPVSVSVTFERPVVDFTAEDLSVLGGSVVNLTGSGDSFIATIAPAQFGSLTVAVPPGSAYDSGGLANIASSQLTFTYAEALVLDVQPDEMNPRGYRPIEFKFTLNQHIFETLSESMLQVAGATIYSFVNDEDDPRQYSLYLTPNGDSQISLHIDSGAVNSPYGLPSNEVQLTLNWVELMTQEQAETQLQFFDDLDAMLRALVFDQSMPLDDALAQVRAFADAHPEIVKPGSVDITREEDLFSFFYLSTFGEVPYIVRTLGYGIDDSDDSDNPLDTEGGGFSLFGEVEETQNNVFALNAPSPDINVVGNRNALVIQGLSAELEFVNQNLGMEADNRFRQLANKLSDRNRFQVAKRGWTVSRVPTFADYEGWNQFGAIMLLAHGVNYPTFDMMEIGVPLKKFPADLLSDEAASLKKNGTPFSTNKEAIFISKKFQNRTNNSKIINVNPYFFKRMIKGKMPNSLVYLAGCSMFAYLRDSTNHDGHLTFPGVFISKKAGAVVGWDNLSGINAASKVAAENFEQLLGSKSLFTVTPPVPVAALDSLDNRLEGWDANQRAKGDRNLYLLDPRMKLTVSDHVNKSASCIKTEPLTQDSTWEMFARAGDTCPSTHQNGGFAAWYASLSMAGYLEVFVDAPSLPDGENIAVLMKYAVSGFYDTDPLAWSSSDETATTEGGSNHITARLEDPNHNVLHLSDAGWESSVDHHFWSHQDFGGAGNHVIEAVVGSTFRVYVDAQGEGDVWHNSDTHGEVGVNYRVLFELPEPVIGAPES